MVKILYDADFFEPDSFRIGIKEDAVKIEFGHIEEIENAEEKFIAHSAIKLTPSALRFLLTELYKTGVNYEEKYHRDIGFSTFANDN